MVDLHLPGLIPELNAKPDVRRQGFGFLLRSAAMIVIRTSPFASSVFIFSFSKKTAMFRSFSSLVNFRQSTVFREKRLIDLVRIMSIFPARQSAIMRLKDSRLAVLVALIPSSAYTSTSHN